LFSGVVYAVAIHSGAPFAAQRAPSQEVAAANQNQPVARVRYWCLNRGTFKLANSSPGRAAAMLSDRDTLLRKLHGMRSEHRDLDTVIARLAEQGVGDQLHLQRLKKRKLMLRDEIAWLESRLIPDSIA
jgi:hypothetical protein